MLTKDAYLANILLLVGIYSMQASALKLPFIPPPKNMLEAEGIAAIPYPHVAAEVAGGSIPRDQWVLTVDSFESDTPPSNAIDGNPNTFWHTQWRAFNAPLPHNIIVDMQDIYMVNGLTILPRQDGNSNGNIGQHQVFVSLDGVDFRSPLAIGTYYDDASNKTTSFEPVSARYVQIVAFTEAGNRGPWTSIAELNIYEDDSFIPPPAGLGKWGITIDFPLVPVAATVEHDTGKVLVWSSWTSTDYSNSNGGQTVTATYDPVNETVSESLVTVTGHDMFCPGISIDGNGRVVVTGGSNNPKTSIYDPSFDTWQPFAELNIGRGYHASATLWDGRIFTIGGSWSGPLGGKIGEIYDPIANTWTELPGCPVDPMLTADVEGVYRADNHAWLFGWRNGHIFQAGPSMAMHWYSTIPGGNYDSAGPRADDLDAMCGIAVMYDAVGGNILTAGGAPNYVSSNTSAAAHLITIDVPGAVPSVTVLSDMYYPREFANAVVLPSGQVFIVGGQSFGVTFSDSYAQLTPEIWDPVTTEFTPVAPHSTPRNYHSFALLMLDGTVMSGGGGLCGPCSANHLDAQIYTPQYLLNPDGSPAVRPAIQSISANSVTIGGSIDIITDSPVINVSLIRFGSATHSVNTDQRRIALQPMATGDTSCTVVLPDDAGVAIPGYWMLFVMNDAGVPSVAKTILIQINDSN